MKQLERRWKVLLVTAVAVFMAFLDVTIVNVAFPSIRADFATVSVAGLAWSVPVLVGARVIQALGAALLVPTSLGLLLPEFPPERRATATALWGAVGGVAAATGPSLGGLLIEWSDWRLVFYVNLVLGALAVVPARRLLHEVRDPDRGAVPGALG